MEELKPCPFCGKHVVLKHETSGCARNYEDGRWEIWHGPFNNDYCPGRNINFQWFKTREEAVSAWNSRVTEKDPEIMKPCPFCGKQNSCGFENHHDLGLYTELRQEKSLYWTVVCRYNHGGCGASSCFRPTQEEALASWNQRAGE